MNDEDIRVNWRATIIVQGNGARVIHGRLDRLGKGRVVIGADHNLSPGCRCYLALMLPKCSPNAASQIIQGRGVVSTSVLSSMQFHITLERLELEGNGEALLEEHIRMHGKRWKKPK